MSRDPIGERGGMNLYSFCVNRPASLVDVKGLLTSSPPSASSATSKPCCYRTPYDPSKECCCEDHKQVTTGGSGAIVQIDDDKYDTRVARYSYTPSNDRTLDHSSQNPAAKGHGWVEWPSTDEEDPGSAGYNRNDNKTYESPDMYAGSRPTGNNGVKVEESVLLSPCKYDIDKFKKCLYNKTMKCYNWPKPHVDCEDYARNLIDVCKNDSEVKGKCTMSECAVSSPTPKASSSSSGSNTSPSQ